MKSIVFCLSLAAAWLVADAALAAEPCAAPAACGAVQTCGAPHHCGCCGCACQCEKHCRVVCEMKEVKKTVWVVKCEDFCAPLPNCGCGSRCKGRESCGACGHTESCGAEPACGEGCGKKCDPCAVEKNKCYIPPKCGTVRTKKTLERKEVVCKAPCYKCVVVYCCPNCRGNEGCDGQAAPAPAKPPAPAPAPGKTTEQAPMPPPPVQVSFAE
jgi:hypothetical protein